jgi:tight adherence protein C
MSDLPASVLAAAAAVALALPLLGWSLRARPGAATAQARQNLIRGYDRPGRALPAGARARARSCACPAR